MKFLFLGVAIVAEVIATTALKQSQGFTQLPWTVTTAAGYAVAFYFLSLALRQIPTGVAYAIWSGLGIVLISLAAWLVNGQRLSLAALVGMGFIILGVVIMNAFGAADVQ
jgi:small multidrug resistance pump